MGIYIEPSNTSRKEANEKTTLLNRPDIAERRKYLQSHTIAETLQITKNSLTNK